MSGTVVLVVAMWWALFWFAIGTVCALGVVFTRWYVRFFEGWKYTDPEDGPSEEPVGVRTMQFMVGIVVGVLMGIAALVLG